MTTFAHNKKATFNYSLVDTFEAGLSLLGTEVKSIKAGDVSLNEAFVVFEDGELFLVKSHIPAFQPANAKPDFDPYRKRKLLLKKAEIARLQKRRETENLTLIPIKLYNKGPFIKLEIALARGKKKSDKREAIKTRDTERDLGRKLKNRR